MGEQFLEATMWLLVLYFMISQIMLMYFWYTIAQAHGFLYTIFIGPFEAMFKGLLWPLFY